MHEHPVNDRGAEVSNLPKETPHGRRHPQRMSPGRGPEAECRDLDASAPEPLSEHAFISQRHDEDFEARAIETFGQQCQLTLSSTDVERGDDVRNLYTSWWGRGMQEPLRVALSMCRHHVF